MTTSITRRPMIPRESPASHRLEGQVAAVGLLSKLAARSSNADAPDLFIDTVSDAIALATAGKIDAAEEHLKGMARILGPAIRDGVVARQQDHAQAHQNIPGNTQASPEPEKLTSGPGSRPADRATPRTLMGMARELVKIASRSKAHGGGGSSVRG